MLVLALIANANTIVFINRNQYGVTANDRILNCEVYRRLVRNILKLSYVAKIGAYTLNTYV